MGGATVQTRRNARARKGCTFWSGDTVSTLNVDRCVGRDTAARKGRSYSVMPRARRAGGARRHPDADPRRFPGVFLAARASSDVDDHVLAVDGGWLGR
jgi:hypothetical protein